MDLSWLGAIFSPILKVLSPLKNIHQWQIWAELKNWYERFKKWRDWYKQHIMAPMKQMQQLQRQIYNQFMKPLLLLVDHIRQLTAIIGIFNKKLADKLNFQFLRIESYILAPMNSMTSRVNQLGRAMTGIVTLLGFLDRGVLLNSIWRDAGLVKEIIHNPFGQHPPAATVPAQPTLQDRVGWTREYLNSDGGPYAADVDAAALNFKGSLAQL